MELEEYDHIHALEEQHWRYRAIRRTLLSALRRHVRRGGAPLRHILDAGCGTGGTTRALAALAPAVGVDLHPRALALARQRTGAAGASGHSNSLPTASFDAVVSVDVLTTARSATARPRSLSRARVPPRRAVVLWLPLRMDALLTRRSATARRYSRARVRELARGAGLRIERLSYVHAPVLLAALLYRGLERLRGGAPRSALSAPPRLLNEMLEIALALEGELALRVPLPFGLSLLAGCVSELVRQARTLVAPARAIYSGSAMFRSVGNLPTEETIVKRMILSVCLVLCSNAAAAETGFQLCPAEPTSRTIRRWAECASFLYGKNRAHTVSTWDCCP
jgi:SAM-dependent methyltransferase